MTALVLDAVLCGSGGNPQTVEVIGWSDLISGDQGTVGSTEKIRHLVEGRDVVVFDGARLGPVAEMLSSSATVLDVRAEIRAADGAGPRIDCLHDAVVAVGAGETGDAAVRDATGVDPVRRVRAGVEALSSVSRVLASRLSLRPGWQLRSAYSLAVAGMQARGIPVSERAMAAISASAPRIRRIALDRLGIGDLAGSLNASGVARALAVRGVPEGLAATAFESWKKDPDGTTAAIPEIRDVIEAKLLLDQLTEFSLPLGADGRVRTYLRPFAARTGRDAPLGSFLFGLPKWTRRIIVPPPGRALIHLDIEAADIGVAAGLSRDEQMWSAYRHGFYESFAKLAGASLQAGMSNVRARYKTAALGAIYGIGVSRLAVRTGLIHAQAQRLLDQHRRIFPDFWHWAQRLGVAAAHQGFLSTALSWRSRFSAVDPPGRCRAFVVQGTGADLLRLATVDAVHHGVAVVATIHDALLVECSSADIEEVRTTVLASFRRASEAVLHGRHLKVNATVIQTGRPWPLTGRAAQMWQQLDRYVGPLEIAHG